MIAKPVLYGGAALAAGALLYILAKKQPGESMAGSLGRSAAGAVFTAAGDMAVGAVKGVGEVFGIPDTNTDQCTKDLAAGRTWDASFSCPASRFLGGVFNSVRINGAAATDAERVDAAIAAQQAAVGGSTGYYDPMGNYVGTW